MQTKMLYYLVFYFLERQYRSESTVSSAVNI
jgi:hypothetical protein